MKQTSAISKLNIDTVLPIVLSMILPLIGIYANPEFKQNLELNFFMIWLSAAIICYILWYSIWFLFQPKLKKVRWWILAIFFILILFIQFYRNSLNIPLAGRHLLRAGFVIILFLVIQYTLRSQKNITRLLIEKEQIQTENYKAQLIALNAKVDPHFLFNSLNTLRSMVRQKHNESEKFIISLSDFYRQNLKHTDNTTLQLSKELAVLESYLFLMKSRNETAVNVTLNVDSVLHDRYLPTLALQIVVENCFKHNSMTSKNPLQIQIYNTEDLYIIVKNNIQAKIGDTPPSGYGLKLLEKRYELMKVENGILIDATPEQFTVKLKLI